MSTCPFPEVLSTVAFMLQWQSSVAVLTANIWFTKPKILNGPLQKKFVDLDLS